MGCLPLQVMSRFVVLFVSLVYVVTVHAQRTCVVADMENHVPIKDAVIHTNTNHWARTDYRGYFAMSYAFDSASVYKSGYVKAYVYRQNLPDTVFLLPESHQLNEVEVLGKDMQQHSVDMMQKAGQDAGKNADVSRGLVNFDAFGWMDRRGIRDRKHRRQAQGIISNLDKDSEDPILDAYHKALQKKKAEEQAKLDALNRARQKKAEELEKQKAAEEQKIANQ